MSKRLSWYVGLTALLAAVTLGSQAQPLTGGLLGRPTADYAYIPAPTGCASGLVPYFNSSLQLVCSPTVYAPATDTTTAGTVVAKNLTASGLATPGAITVTPVLSKIGAITVVAGSLLADGDGLVVGDGTGTVPIEFDASPGDGTTGGAVPIIFDGTETATQIRDAVKAILDGAGRDWTTSAQGADGIGLVRATPGATGGGIAEDVTNAGFLVTDWTDPTAATTYTYRLVWRLPDGTTTEGGAASSTAAGVATLTTANRNDLTWAAGPAGTVTDVYRTVGGATQGKIAAGLTGTTLSDTGLAGGGETAPTVDGTGRLTSDALTAGRVAIVGAGGRVEDDAGLTYDPATDTLTSGRVVVGAGSAAAPTVAVGASDAGMVMVLAGVLGISTGGTERFRVFSGNVEVRNSVLKLSNSGGNAVYLYRADAATLQLGDANSATPVAQADRSQGGSGTNIAGQRRNRQGSLATGTADSGAIVDQTGYTAGATTTQHAYSDRSGLFARWTALTAGAATGFATLTYAASTSIGAEFFVTIRAGDGTNRQGMSYRVAVNSVRDAAGNTQSVVAVIGTPPVAAGSGTLTCTFDVAEGAGAATLRANCASSLTETFLDANFQTIANGPGLTIAPL